MTEADLLYQLSETINRLWTLVQWWASISFGLILVGHFAADKITRLLMALLVSIYVVFSILMAQLISKNSGVMNAIHRDIENLSGSERVVTATAQYWLDNQNTPTDWILLVALVGTFLGVIGYLVYCYLRSHK